MSAETSVAGSTTLAKLSERLQRVALDVAWSQWRALGATTTTRVRARSMVDPEALVLISLDLGATEPRLVDIVADWGGLNSSLLSVQRMKNLAARRSTMTRERLGAFARVALEDGKDFRWRALAAAAHDGITMMTRRTNKTRAVKARRFDVAAVWLQLRLGLGVGIKADTLAFLLGTAEAPASVRVVATATGYTPAAVGRALDDLAVSGLVHLEAEAGEPARYHARLEAWTPMLGLNEPVPPWRNWSARFAFIHAFLAWAAQSGERPVSRYAFGVHGRTLIEEHAIVFGRTKMPSRGSREPDWATYVETSVSELAARIASDV